MVHNSIIVQMVIFDHGSYIKIALYQPDAGFYFSKNLCSVWICSVLFRTLLVVSLHKSIATNYLPS